MNRKQQSGFTLIEIAIVLVIIGLLIGGMIKGQELINNAKVKNLAADLRSIPTLIYGYQDKYKSLPGDDSKVATHLPGTPTLATTPIGSIGNGSIDGFWNTITTTDESLLVWQHLRLAGLATGSTEVAAKDSYWPTNAVGGRIGIESTASGYIQNVGGGTSAQGAHIVCSSMIAGKLALQLDTMLDDGDPQRGSVRIVTTNHTRGEVALEASAILSDADLPRTVCMGI